MNIRLIKTVLMIPLLAVTHLAGVVPAAIADDTEIFFNSPASLTSSGRPKVLIVFDDSGSMRTLVATRPPYDPNETYNGGIDGAELDRVYYSTDGVPPGSNSNNWFSSSVNRCASSYFPLQEEGVFPAAVARRWSPETTEEICEVIQPPQCPSGYNLFAGFCIRWFPFSIVPLAQQCTIETNPGTWANLNSSINNPPHVECRNDVQLANPGNGPGVADGYPLDDVPDAEVFDGAAPTDSNFAWGDTIYTLYSGHYIDYWNDSSIIESRTRLAIAQDVISSLVTTATNYDFGLMLFNDNSGSSDDGGRLVARIRDDMTAAERADLVSLIENDLDAVGATPLCESYYEVYRYFSGKSVLYGLERDTGGTPDRDLPVRDTDAEDDSGNYIPPSQDCGPVYAILMTDGLPSLDTNANSAIETLTGETCDSWPDDDGGGPESKNCLPELAGYMATEDIDQDASNGEQNAVTYTIGFDISQPLLEETADRGTGQYFEARTAGELATAFQVILNDISDLESTFTSPAVAVDSFSRNRTEDAVYYAMFEPDNKPDWRGNVKKLRLAFPDGEAPQVVDRNGDLAINASNGEIINDADTFWSTDDGGFVSKGGVGGLLAARDPATRTLYTNTGSSGALEAFTSANMTRDAFGFATDADLFNFFGVGGQANLDKVIAWAQGYGFNPDGSISSVRREWVMGDPLHSQPQLLNYGALGSFDPNNPDLRILVGTNTGFLHMFGDSDGVEDWAFFPKELAGVLNKRRINAVSSEQVYGVDLTPVAYLRDVGLDGTINSTDGDTVWVYQGLRRGGNIYYALDLSNPDSPSYMWSASPIDAGLSELGQTWSEPVVTKIPGYVDAQGVPKPVVIFGAGYDPDKDSKSIGTADDQGRGVFILDAQTGALVRSITPTTRTDKNLRAQGLSDSVPGGIATLDSNGDGLTDRLYFGDTGGNLWRVDINPGLPDFTGGETWHFNKLASFGSGSNALNDRRFFNTPEIVRIRGANGKPVDAVLIGSGDRTNPLNTDVRNFFYNVWDEQVVPYTTPAPTTAECVVDPNDPPPDFRCNLPITNGTLFNITNQTLNDTTLAGLGYIPNGWRLRLTNLGEKSLSDSITLLGVVLFTTYTPPGVIVNAEACEPVLGSGLLRLVDLYSGERTEVALGPIIPDTPAVVVDPDGGFGIIPTPGAPPKEGDADNPPNCKDGYCDLFLTFPGPYGNFWYREDY
ncbi:MAG: PilC/PilY family type IV pilus protein [Gammaproteobacteria bacterium]|nr:PilC/PilY family type IV pilus protein [Gammaproteobacteria bacterium]